ncbi:unnamed protein product [Protopolystoma xenopodis]|uniref:N-terminal methionine N(alpha)-acetyltransferase NatE n=1 Tax=Protopolystoma xenopodis TaxID=117903 RepID=A0A448X101_9PLAT|nr:unnamed protein product [Protopolystoma xenopodis]
MCRLAYFNDIVVGAVCYRIDSISATTGTDTGKAAKMEGTSSGQKKLYIMTLGCLAPYRRLGIGSMLLRHVSKFCHKHGHLESIFLHVQVSNTDAVEFYKKFGFSISGEIKGYYRRITPQGAYILEKRLPDSDVHDYSSDSE